MIEIWKDIPSYEGYYQASNTGRIKSILFQNNVYNKKYFRKKILKPKITKDCCSRVELWKDGKHKTYLVHRLIATTFLENLLHTKMTVNHKDGNRLNNNIENLEWVSLKENTNHAIKIGLKKLKIPLKKYEYIKNEYLKGRTTIDLAKEFNVCYNCIREILIKQKIVRRKGGKYDRKRIRYHDFKY